MFLCELPVGSEHAASRAKQQATVKYIYIYIYIYRYIDIYIYINTQTHRHTDTDIQTQISQKHRQGRRQNIHTQAQMERRALHTHTLRGRAPTKDTAQMTSFNRWPASSAEVLVERRSGHYH